MRFADILLFRGIQTYYTYAIPEELSIQPGTHVDIPLGTSKTQGLVMRCFEASASPKIKNILSISPKKPILSQEILDFIHWFSDYYLITPYKAYQTIIGNMKLRKLPADDTDPTQTTVPIYSLTPEQHAAIQTIVNGGSGKRYLIFGVTASGKTEVYIRVAQSIIAQEKTVLMLLPEIALTPQLQRAFKSRFGNIVAVIHSGLTAKEREIEWNRILLQKVKIVIGARSALFVPLENIGLVIVDEEHEPSYKQDSNPRYFLHTLADYRARYHNAIQIFGSATPSIETYAQMSNATCCDNTETDVNSVIQLKNRVLNQAMPPIEIIDMREEPRETQSHALFSQILLDKIRQKLTLKEKIIILINRRGFSTYISCQRCGTVLTCPQCQLSYTFHRDQIFRCHRCDIQIPMTHTCPKCKKNSLNFSGLGIQKVEMELRQFFPQASIHRIDRDSIKDIKMLDEQLEEFRETGDILIGTQLIAKGHHFEDVTLVGILGIDTILNMPDFRSSERVFQLITQVAGRAGRSYKPGEVILQTLQPDHPAITYAATYDYDGFYEHEIEFREQLMYPPFSTLIHILISSQNASDLKAYTQELAIFFQTQLVDFKKTVRCLGPEPAPIEMIKGFYRYHILLKCAHTVIPDIKTLLTKLPPKKTSIRLIFDFDPRSIL